MFPEVTKFSDDMRKGEWAGQIYNLSGPNGRKTATPGKIYKRLSTSPCVGSKRQSMFNRTKSYVPKNGMPHPIIHFNNSGDASKVDVMMYQVIYDQLLPAWRLTGEVVTCIESVSTPNFKLLKTPTEADLAFLVKAVSRSRDSAAQLGVTLAEVPETLDMMRDPFSKLARYGTKLVPRKGQHYASLLTNAWLTFRYGILPLMGEVDTYRKLVDKKLEMDFGPLLKSRAGQSLPEFSADTDFVRNSGAGFHLHGTDKIRSGTTVMATNYYRRSMTRNQALGIDADSFPSFVWELIPYSFVIDWFLDVGDWLQAISPNSSVVDYGNCLSVKSYTEATVFVRYVSQNRLVSASFPASPLDARLAWKSESYQRQTNLTLPALPQVNRSLLGLARSLDSVTLAYQRAKNCFPRGRR